MLARARPTIRCLEEYLTDGWEDVSHLRLTRSVNVGSAALPNLPDLAHPLIRHAAAVFRNGHSDDEGGVARESITGLTDPPFWKVKTGRWRGAVWQDPESGDFWLVAGGLRRENEAEDFYKAFMRAISAGGSAPFLPSADDRARAKYETVAASLLEWELELQRAVIEAVEAALTSPQKISIADVVGDRAVATVTLSVETVDMGEAEGLLSELTLEVATLDFASAELIARAEIVIMTALCPYEQDWTAGHTGSEHVYSLLETQDALLARMSTAAIGRPGEVIAGTISHYADAAAIGDGSVQGTAVRALCGVHFVPRQDHAPMEVCGSCAELVELMRLKTTSGGGPPAL
ncbi:DUF3039 domain-containing protein [Nakamurella alba]|nr:DUF3039 domain-containing protein [Nakamurella alba]